MNSKGNPPSTFDLTMATVGATANANVKRPEGSVWLRINDATRQAVKSLTGIENPSFFLYPSDWLHEFLSQGVYGVTAGAADKVYYCELLDHGTLTWCYQQIIGGRRIAQFSVDEMEKLVARLAQVATQAYEELDTLRARVNAAEAKDAGLPERHIDADVLEVLRAGRTDGNHFYLPPVRLDRKLYQKVDAVLKDLEGRWVGRKTMAHVFEGPADEAVAAVLATGTYTRAKDFGFFPTPDAVARQVVELADLRPGMRVLEPSAGTGSLASLAAAVVGHANVTTYELLDRNVEKLREAGFGEVVKCDFLSVPPEPIFDRIVMNPPFGGFQDVVHVQHAARFLKPDGVMVAITSPGHTFRNDAKAQAFRGFLEDSESESWDVAAGAFKDSGTDVRTVILRLEAANFPWNQAEKRHSRSLERVE